MSSFTTFSKIIPAVTSSFSVGMIIGAGSIGVLSYSSGCYDPCKKPQPQIQKQLITIDNDEMITGWNPDEYKICNSNNSPHKYIRNNLTIQE